MDTLTLFFELIGTVAFAASGAMTGLRKRMDIFGVCILGATTAVGGGVIRDLVLGNTPPATFRDPIYPAASVLTSLLLFCPQIRRLLMRDPQLYDRMLFMMDSLGLGVFTVAGIQTAYGCVESPSWFLLAFVGVVTGVGGGVLRDIMAGDVPYIFRKHIYASASLAGALLCAGTWKLVGEMPAVLAGTGSVLAIRGLSAHFRWDLPQAKRELDS